MATSSMVETPGTESVNLDQFAVVDLFCGIGGLSHGFLLEGFNVTAGIDVDPTCRYPFEANNNGKFVLTDVSTLSGNNLDNLYGGKRRILIGCAPCQPFSSYTFKDKVKDTDKWGLLYHFSRLVEEVQPDIVSMENVAQLVNFKKAPVFQDFVDSLQAQGYFVHYEVVNCLDYGIPQTRRRLVLLASKTGEISLIPKTHSPKNYKTVRDAIGDLPPIEDGQSHADDIVHFARKLNALNKRRIQHTPYGGGWKDWPEELRLTCHNKDTGKSYTSVYGRMTWEKPSPTITTHCVGYGNGRFGHPIQDRAISLREAAILQTFPKNYKFFDPQEEFQSVLVARHLGNAVPVELGTVIAKSIKKHLENKAI